MKFDVALNLIWLALGLYALTSTLRARRARARIIPGTPVWLHVCGVALIVAALFPCISATDDVLRIEHMDAQHAQHQHGESGRKNPTDGLMRLYEAIDTSIVCAVPTICPVFLFIGMVIVVSVRLVEAKVPQCGGRSPPFATT